MAAHDILMAAAGGSTAATYIEDVFSTWLYTGNGSTQTITNGIDLSTYDGLVWCKNREAVSSHELSVTRSDLPLILRSNATDAWQQGDISGFHSAGFFLQNVVGNINQNGKKCVSWTFRKQPKFFDVVTYTGDGTSSRNISHSLGSTPGCVIVKRTDSTSNWFVSHVGYNSGLAYTGVLNSTAAFASGTQVQVFYSTSTTFRVGTGANDSGATYVAYLFAHNAGGFGLTGTDNVISCGSYTGNGAAGNAITLGYEPQFIIVKRTDTTGNWLMFDNMRGMSQTDDAALYPNLSNAEANYGFGALSPSATGFVLDSSGLNTSGGTYIYIAIRRGPMKTPTSGTSVFSPNVVASPGSGTGIQTITTNFPVDMTLSAQRNASQLADKIHFSRLTGEQQYLATNSIAAEQTTPSSGYKQSFQSNTALIDSFWGLQVGANSSTVYWNFLRAPGFMDEVCYTASGAIPSNINHNLGVVPELMIIKKRNSADTWGVYSASLGNTKEIALNNSGTPTTNTNIWNSTTPTASVFTVGNDGKVNTAGDTYVAYLFASCPGVSKVGSYTGTGATQTISCGFAARFVMIRRTDNTGDWLVWDTSRGMVAGTDPRLAISSTAAELNNNWVYTDSSGFQIVTANTAVNASGSTYIYLAIA